MSCTPKYTQPTGPHWVITGPGYVDTYYKSDGWMCQVISTSDKGAQFVGCLSSVDEQWRLYYDYSKGMPAPELGNMGRDFRTFKFYDS